MGLFLRGAGREWELCLCFGGNILERILFPATVTLEGRFEHLFDSFPSSLQWRLNRQRMPQFRCVSGLSESAAPYSFVITVFSNEGTAQASRRRGRKPHRASTASLVTKVGSYVGSHDEVHQGLDTERDTTRSLAVE